MNPSAPAPAAAPAGAGDPTAGDMRPEPKPKGSPCTAQEKFGDEGTIPALGDPVPCEENPADPASQSVSLRGPRAAVQPLLHRALRRRQPAPDHPGDRGVRWVRPQP